MSSFREKVYNAVRRIPRGKVATYGAIARRIGAPGASRAVGSALGKNRFEDIPCHRVVRSDLQVGNYAWGTSRKIKTLKLEGVIIKGNKVSGKSLWY